MAGIGNSDFLRMQEEAVARVREMQKRAKVAIGENIEVPNPHHGGNNKIHKKEEAPQRAEVHIPALKEPEGLFNIPLLKDLNIDRDVLIILVLAFILISDEVDIMLLLALGYILL